MFSVSRSAVVGLRVAFRTSIRYTFRPNHLLPHSTRFVHSTPSRLTTPLANRKCPSCSQPLPSALPACTNCWHISVLPSDTVFHDVFALPYQPNPFVVDVSVLKERFRRAQAVCHPDSWASKGSSKQDVAQVLSARVNEAYQCLLKPLSRAEYILQRHHIPVLETDQVDNMEFMSEIMQARETIDDAENPDEVIALIGENQAQIQQAVQDLERLVGRQQWEDVKTAVVRLRYLEGIDFAAKKWIDNH